MNVHTLVKSAIRDGRLARQDVCSVCGGNSGVVAHHDDYSKPLEIRWLCRKCHMKWHAENGPGKHRERANINPRPKKKDKVVRNDEMQSLAAEGWNYDQIGKKYGLTRERVRQILGNRHIAFKWGRLLKAAEPQITAMRLARHSLREISAATGIPVQPWLQTFNALPEKPAPLTPHGTWNGYVHHKCRCELCRRSNNDRTKMRVAKLRSEGKCITCRRLSESYYCADCKPTYGRKGRKIGISGVRGIIFNKSADLWCVVRCIDGKQKYYGGFRELEDAKKKRDEVYA